MSPEVKSQHETVLESAEVLLTERGMGCEGHSFILSKNEAVGIGHAVNSRDHKTLREILGGAVDRLEEDYDTITFDDLRPVWEDELRNVTGIDGNFLEIIDSKEGVGRLDDVLSGRVTPSRLNLSPTATVKLLETLVYATAPEGIDDFNPSHATSPRYRKQHGGLYARSLNLLERYASEEPGIRKVREGLLAENELVLDRYLTSYAKARLAQKACANIIEQFSEGRADELRQSVREQLADGVELEALVETHILDWELLPPGLSDPREYVKSQANDTEDVRRAWEEERINGLFNIAELARQQGRSAQIFVSNTFDNGAGLYLAAVLSHPIDKTRSVVIADNPIKGNALYIVDEQLTEFDTAIDQQYGWREVLGQHKQVARQRGARRRYHSGNWSELARAVCEYGGDYQLAKAKRAKHDKRQQETVSQAPTSLMSTAARQALMEAIKRAEEQSKASNIDDKYNK